MKKIPDNTEINGRVHILNPLVRLALVVVLLALATSTALAVERGSIFEPLNLPAVESSRATKARLFGITRAGERLVVVGQRGFILYSDDEGQTWVQAKVPVRTTLLSVYFPTPDDGWAVGHDGVILHSADRGETWVKQLDGYEAVEIALKHYDTLLADDPENETYLTIIDDLLFAQEQGADRPFFMVWFQDENTGYAVGAYNLAMATSNGGDDWFPIMEFQANPDFRHLYDYAILDGKRFIAGESGVLWIQDEPDTPTRAAPYFYDGSLYTVTTTCDGKGILTGGLGGNTFVSHDYGETWQQVNLGTTAAVVGSTCLQDGRLVLVTQAGQILVSRDAGQSFEYVKVENPFPLSAVEEGRPGELVVVGLGGVRTVVVD